jgi:hypothetical protein
MIELVVQFTSDEQMASARFLFEAGLVGCHNMDVDYDLSTRTILFLAEDDDEHIVDNIETVASRLGLETTRETIHDDTYDQLEDEADDERRMELEGE